MYFDIGMMNEPQNKGGGFRKFMGQLGQGINSFFGSAGGGAALGIANNVLEGINYRKRSREAFKRQLEMMREQYEKQRMLNQQGADLSYENWLRTNYPAQVEQMKKAGLSVGLMYGKGGGQGGTTAGSGGGASMGSAPTGNMSGMPLDIMNSVSQASLLKAQKENIEADTTQKVAQANESTSRKTGIDIDNEMQQVINQYEKDLTYNYENLMTQQANLENESRRILNDSWLSNWKRAQAELDYFMDKETREDRIDMIEAVKIGQELKNKWDASGIAPGETSYKQMWNLMTEKGYSDYEKAWAILAGGVGEEIFKTLVPAGIIGKFIGGGRKKFGEKAGSVRRTISEKRGDRTYTKTWSADK